MTQFYSDNLVTLYHCDAAHLPLADGTVQTCVTSPPYWGLRDYGIDGQIGLEPTPAEYVARLVTVFREVRRVLRDDGTAWLNLGSSYAGSNQTGGMGSKEGSAKRAGRMFKKPAEIGAAVDLNGCEPFALRDDLSVDETVHVLSELAAHIRQSHEVAKPNSSVRIDEGVTSFADGEQV